MGTKSKNRRRSYPWEIWFGSDRFRLTHGRDFFIQTHGMAQMVRNHASSRGVRVSLQISADDRVIDVTVLNGAA